MIYAGNRNWKTLFMQRRRAMSMCHRAKVQRKATARRAKKKWDDENMEATRVHHSKRHRARQDAKDASPGDGGGSPGDEWQNRLVVLYFLKSVIT